MRSLPRLKLPVTLDELELQSMALYSLEAAQQLLSRFSPNYRHRASVMRNDYRATFLGAVGKHIVL